MPQLDLSTFFSQIFWCVLTFAMLFLLLNNIFLPRLSKIFAERDATISDILAQTERTKAEAERLKAEYDSSIENALDNKNTIILAAVAEINRHIDEQMAIHNREFELRIKKAEENLVNFTENSMDDIAKIAQDVAFKILTEVIGLDVEKKIVHQTIKNLHNSNQDAEHV